MTETVEVRVPDIGDFTDIPVIELLVQVGDRVAPEDPLVTLESDKATMDVPAPSAGTVAEINVAVGDEVSEGSLLMTLSSVAGAPPERAATPAPPPRAHPEPPAAEREPDPDAEPEADAVTDDDAEPEEERSKAAERERGRDPAMEPDPRAPSGYRPSPPGGLPSLPGRRTGAFHATPSVRRFAGELGVDLKRVRGTGRKGRIQREDVTKFVKAALIEETPSSAASGGGIPAIPEVDFSRFGEVETRPLSRIKRISGPHLHRSWLNVPLVTHVDEADVTELEAFRRSLRTEGEARGVRVTVLAFILKALVAALREFPSFNTSLAPDGQSLVIKHYYHLGIAVDTPNGLVVPVLRSVDEKSIFALAEEMQEVSSRARDGKLRREDIEGSCMSVSSLGGIGGTAFTPLVNAPEVAILGVARARMAPWWDGAAFLPRMMLPLCLSYDHRVIDGAEAARFVAHLCATLGDVRRLLL